MVEFGAGVGRCQRNLDGVRIDIDGVLNGLFDGFASLARETQNKRAMNNDAEFAAVAGESPAMSVRRPLRTLCRI